MKKLTMFGKLLSTGMFGLLMGALIADHGKVQPAYTVDLSVIASGAMFFITFWLLGYISNGQN